MGRLFHPSRLVACVLATALSAVSASAQKGPPPRKDYPPPSDYSEPAEQELAELLAQPEDVAWFRNAKLGIMIHWGPVTLTGEPMSWGRRGPRPGANRRARNGVPQAEYDQLYRKFDPVNFDAGDWLEAIEGSGAKYFVFTTKHHDGFAMWDTETSEYDIMNSPFGRDIVGELAAAAEHTPVRTMWYYSQPDWHHPNALQDGHYEKYLPYMKAQLNELLTKYGDVDGIFFDHLGSNYYHWDTISLLPELRRLQAGLIVNNRIGNRLPKKYQGDYHVYELSVGPYGDDRVWESAITLSKAWAWHGGDLTKSPEATLRMFLQVIGNGGNLTLNIAPQPDGEIFAKDKEVLAHLGQFTEKYAEAIYETRKGLYKPGVWGVSTTRDNELYLFLLEQSANGELTVDLPSLPVPPTAIDLLSEGTLESNYDVGLHLKVRAAGDATPPVVRLQFDRPLDQFGAIETFDPARRIELQSITASSERDEKFSVDTLMGETGRGVFGEGVHIKNWWEPSAEDPKPQLLLELSEPTEIQSIVISESIRSFSVEKFSVDYRGAHGDWHSVYRGSTIGEALAIRLDTPETSAVRVTFEQASDGSPNITAIDLIGRTRP